MTNVSHDELATLDELVVNRDTQVATGAELPPALGDARCTCPYCDACRAAVEQEYIERAAQEAAGGALDATRKGGLG